MGCARPAILSLSSPRHRAPGPSGITGPTAGSLPGQTRKASSSFRSRSEAIAESPHPNPPPQAREGVNESAPAQLPPLQAGEVDRDEGAGGWGLAGRNSTTGYTPGAAMP